MKRIGLIFFILTSALLFARCASTGFLMSKAKVTLFGETYPPKDTETKIDVFMTNKPTQDYVEFAQLTCKDNNDKWRLVQITKNIL